MVGGLFKEYQTFSLLLQSQLKSTSDTFGSFLSIVEKVANCAKTDEGTGILPEKSLSCIDEGSNMLLGKWLSDVTQKQRLLVKLLETISK